MYGKSEKFTDYQKTARPVVAMAKSYPRGHRSPPHSHRRGQLIFASTGVMTVITSTGRWVIPPTRGIWIPGGITHAIEVSSTVSMRTVYIEPRCAKALPKTCAVIGVTGLLRELILSAVKISNDYEQGGRDARLMRLMVDEIKPLDVTPLHLPMPVERRCLAVAKKIVAEPGAVRDLKGWADIAHVSPRTLARLFASELGISFGRWCQQARLQASLDLLAKGGSILDVALDVGYENPSAFAYAFRRCFGVAPSDYFG